MSVIDKVLEIATNEIGYIEKKGNSSLYDKTANAGSNNYTKYWQDIKPSYQGEPWCAAFVTWCFVQAFGKENAKAMLRHYPYVYCPEMASLFKLHENPKVGDIVLFYRNNTFAHTGIVRTVNGDFFTTIEGNTSSGGTIVPNGGEVCSKSYYNSSLPGTKFVTPDYNILKENNEMTDSEKKRIDVIDDTLKNVLEIVEKQTALIDSLSKIVYNISNKMIYNYIDENMPEWAREAVKKAVYSGVLQGEEDGKLGLTYSDLRTIVREYRLGLYN